MAGMKRWSAEDSLELYNIKGWGQGYFDVDGSGSLLVRPHRGGEAGIELVRLVEDAQSRGLALPLLIRFSDILNDRLGHLCRCFRHAIESTSYQGRYFAVYPIKVNQRRQVVEEIVRLGADLGLGLEAGSKAELFALLGLELGENTLIICNGYKDSDYIRLALMAQKLGKTIFLVVEKPGELGLILQIARQEGIHPSIGIRLKLVASGAGTWEDSGGDASKFGLTAPELVEAVDLLRRERALETFRLIHFHLGSQIPNLRHIRNALREMARYYAELAKLGCRIEYVDVGGGLGVDYDGSRSANSYSINYSEQEYADAVVGVLAETCRREELPHPHIVTESGRALTAHHAMLAINVFETARMANGRPPAHAGGDPHEVVAQLATILKGLGGESLSSCWRNALQVRDRVNGLFEAGSISLRQRARAEQIFWQIAGRIEIMGRRQMDVPEEIGELETLLADKYFCNFSVFQSLPDAWAMDQQFPVVPLHRLDEKPTRRAILQDLTCDSDGQIAQYIGTQGKMRTLPLHPLRKGEPYYLGVFLIGAYQEILGDLHNLYGDTNTVQVAMNGDGTWRYEQIIAGETVADVLDTVQFKKHMLIDRIERQVRAGLKADRITRNEATKLQAFYATGLDGYTYLQGGSKQK